MAIAQGHRSADASARFAAGLKLMDGSDCKACHSVEKKSIGPAYQQIALKYKNDLEAAGRLAQKIISGGAGAWGEIPMSAHPQLSLSDATEMVNYILSLSEKPSEAKSLPVKGSVVAKVPEGDKGEGIYVLRAAYKDKGAGGVPGISAEKTYTLRNAKTSASTYHVSEGVQIFKVPQMGPIVIGSENSYIGFRNIDLTGISEIDFIAFAPKEQANAAGGRVEMRLGSPTGKVVGESTFIKPVGMAEMATQAPAALTLSDISGEQDIYFVYKNPDAPKGQILFVIKDILFKMKEKDGGEASNLKEAEERN